MRNLTKRPRVGNNEIQFNTGELKKSADLFPAINSGKSPLALEEIRAELRSIIGTPLRDHADRLRRQFLWRRLDQLIALAWGRR
jgi:hypothetical protein